MNTENKRRFNLQKYLNQNPAPENHVLLLPLRVAHNNQFYVDLNSSAPQTDSPNSAENTTHNPDTPETPSP